MYATVIRSSARFALFFAAAIGLARESSAAVIVGGGGLMSQAYANKLEGWLGEGPLQFTNVYTKQTGDDSYDFHAAADGKGRTVTLVEILSGNVQAHTYTNSFHATIPTQIVGGYNPHSWSSNGGYNIISSTSSREAFIFNLTTDAIHRQRADYFAGQYQTYNAGNYGPTFGGGHDLYVNLELQRAYATGYSYGQPVFDGAGLTTSIVSVPNASEIFSVAALYVGRLEVYTLSSAPAAVPEPATMALWGIGAAGVAAMRFRRRRKTQGESISQSA